MRTRAGSPLISIHSRGASFKWLQPDVIHRADPAFFMRSAQHSSPNRRNKWAVIRRTLWRTIYGCVLVYPQPSTQGTAENTMLSFRVKFPDFDLKPCQLQTYFLPLPPLFTQRNSYPHLPPPPVWPLSHFQQRQDKLIAWD
jgi:hypothetical protein